MAETVIDGVVYSSTSSSEASVIRYDGDGGALELRDAVRIGGRMHAVTTIADAVFENARIAGRLLTSVVLPRGLTDLGASAFLGNELRTITLPDSLRVLGPNAFESNEDLARVDLGTGVETLAGWNFAHTALRRVTIPASVTFIGAYTFEETPLELLRFDGPPPEVPEEENFAQPGNLTIHYRPEFDASEYDGGFTTPTWNGHRTYRMRMADELVDPPGGFDPTPPIPRPDPWWRRFLRRFR